MVGLDLLDGRDVTITGQLVAPAGAAFFSAWSAFAGATVAGGSTEIPIYVNVPSAGTLAMMGRVRKRNLPMDFAFSQGFADNVILQFSCSDPRLYSTPTLTTTASPPSISAGFTFPFSFPFTFGGGSVAGSVQVTNSGDIELRPILTVTGPCTNPSITLASASNSPNLTFNVTMAAGDQLVIDTDFHTATYYTSGSTIGSTRLYTLAQGSQWFVLPASTTSTLQFLTSDPTATGTLSVEAPAAAYIL